MASGSASIISAGTVIRGRVRAEGDLEIHGHVEGSVVATGDVVVGASGLVKSDIEAATIRVAGAVAGDLRGEELVVLEAGARVVGAVLAPTIGIRPGALVRGRVDTGEVPHPATTRAPSATASRTPPLRSDSKSAAEAKAAPSRTAATGARIAPSSRAPLTVAATPAARAASTAQTASPAASHAARAGTADSKAKPAAARPTVSEPPTEPKRATDTRTTDAPTIPQRRAPAPIAPALSKRSKKVVRRSGRD